MALIGLGLLLVTELVVVLLVRGLTLNEYIASRDAVSGTVYLALLAVFAVMAPARWSAVTWTDSETSWVSIPFALSLWRVFGP